MSLREPIAVLAGMRTPLAKSYTTLSRRSAVELGVCAVGGAIAAAESNATSNAGSLCNEIDELVIGNVAQPPDAANLARVVALRSGLSNSTIAHTVHRNCGSGMEALIAASEILATRRGKFVVAGGTESMSQIPWMINQSAIAKWMRLAKSKTMLQRARALLAFRPSDFKPTPGVQLGLTDPVCGLNMGQTAEVLAKEFAITRDQQDRYALESHVRASLARERCFLSGEIVPCGVSSLGDSDGVTKDSVTKDNGPREHQSLESLTRLRPMFDPHGTVTAGNSCPLTDGAAAMVLSTKQTAMDFQNPLGYLVDYAIAGCEPRRMGLGPVYAIAKLLNQTGLSMRDFELIELNEAFAAQVIACQRAAESKSFAQQELRRSKPLGEILPDRMNVHGGAIALGHPVGATGTRLVLTLLRALRERGLRRGLATLCVGGGQGMAMMVQTELED